MAASHDILAKKFAKALLDVLMDNNEEKKLDTYAQQLDQIGTLRHGESQDFLVNPLFSTDEKAKVLEHALDQIEALPKMRQFVLAVNAAGYASLVYEIAQAFGSALLARNQKVRVVVTSAKKLDASIQKDLTQTFTAQLGKEVLLDTEVDPSLLGGLRAVVGGVVYDSTISGYLDRLGKQFLTHQA